MTVQRFRINIFFAALLGLMLSIAGNTSLPVIASVLAVNEPISIEADQMESVRKDNAVFFTGNVEARQGELVIQADEMTVYYGQADGAASDMVDKDSIRRLVARGHVVIIRQDWVARGDEVEYLAQEQKVFLTGKTTVQQEGNVVSGERVVLFLNEGRSVIEGSPDGGRVKGVFRPQQEK